MGERFKKIGDISSNIQITNKRKKKLKNGQTVYFSTLKRNRKKKNKK